MGSDVKLSGSDRRDLGRLCLVAALSAGFLATPLILAEDPVPQAAAATEEVAPRVTIVTTDVSAQVLVPELAGPITATHSAAARLAPRPQRARTLSSSSRVSTPPTPPAASMRRFGRWIAGDGRYAVRPFPTVHQD